MTRAASSLQIPDAQPYTARLAGAGALLAELEAVLSVAPEDASAADFRRLIMQENAARKSTANARMWAWKRLKLRYLLDAPTSFEFRAFRKAWGRAHTAEDRRAIAGLLFARTDRLFRDVSLETVSPRLARPGEAVNAESVRSSVEERMREAGLTWSDESVSSITNHLLSALDDFGLIEGHGTRRIRRLRVGMQPTTLAAELGKLEGLTDRAVVDSRWFRFLGLDTDGAIEALRGAARAGALRFRMQADVVELVIGEEASHQVKSEASDAS